jgi:hypothetical protein
MRFSSLKSVGHNIADSLASGCSLLIGVEELNVFKEASSGPDGYIDIDFLRGSSSGASPSLKLQRAIALYKKALPSFCEKHGVRFEAVRTLRARFGVDRAYGMHFTVTVENAAGKRSTDRYIGIPGRRLRLRRR